MKYPKFRLEKSVNGKKAFIFALLFLAYFYAWVANILAPAVMEVAMMHTEAYISTKTSNASLPSRVLGAIMGPIGWNGFSHVSCWHSPEVYADERVARTCIVAYF